MSMSRMSGDGSLSYINNMDLQNYVNYLEGHLMPIAPTDQMDTAQMFFERLRRPDMWLIYLIILTLNILFYVVVGCGAAREWYTSLDVDLNNIIAIGIVWFFSIIASYGALLRLWEIITPYNEPADYKVAILFLIGCFINLLWAIVFFYAEDTFFAFWIAVIIVIYQVGLAMYVWTLNSTAAMLMLPALLLYVYILYETVHTSSVNDLPI